VSEAPPNPRPADDDSLIQGRNWFTAGIEEWIAAHTPSCTHITRMVSDSLDRPAGWRTRFTLRLHYLVCCYCRRYEEQLHWLRRFARGLPGHLEEAPAGLDESAKQRIKERLRDAR
jgi:hypothetical protein